jgi:hypothetical protein
MALTTWQRGALRRMKLSRIARLRLDLPEGYIVCTWSPGDGVTRYRFFKNAPAGQTYFGPDNGIFTALGMKEAEAFARGLEVSP